MDYPATLTHGTYHRAISIDSSESGLSNGSLSRRIGISRLYWRTRINFVSIQWDTGIFQDSKPDRSQRERPLIQLLGNPRLDYERVPTSSIFLAGSSTRNHHIHLFEAHEQFKDANEAIWTESSETSNLTKVQRRRQLSLDPRIILETQNQILRMLARACRILSSCLIKSRPPVLAISVPIVPIPADAFRFLQRL